MSKILPVSGCRNSDRSGDVIFVHGLGGHALGTWHPQGKKSEDKQFWPAWLGQDLPDVGVWTLQYEVETSAWKGSTMPLIDQANIVLGLLEDNKLGSCPIVFIAHSMGGLLVKQLLKDGQESSIPEWKNIVRQVRGIIFLSTPHSSSNLANWINYLSNILRASVSADELRASDILFRNLNHWFLNNIQRFRISAQCYYETQKTGKILVVDRANIDHSIPNTQSKPVNNANHISICKPESQNNPLYKKTTQFIRECLPTGYFGNTFLEELKDKSFQIYGANLPYESIKVEESEVEEALSSPDNIRAWKKIHNLTEDFYSKFLEFEHQMIRYNEVFEEFNWTKQQKYLQDAEKYLSNLRRPALENFQNSLAQLPSPVRNTRLVSLLSDIPVFYEGIKFCLSRTEDPLYLERVKEITKRVRIHLLHALHVADKILESYLGD